VQPEEAKRRAELAKKRAQQMRTQFFSLGNWQLTADVLNRFLNTPEVKRLLPGSARQTRCEQANAKFAAELLSAAERFCGEIVGTEDGRRTESDTNAFGAALSALMPADLVELRAGQQFDKGWTVTRGHRFAFQAC
jgi:hypothetical protein